jgi:hypothetical protein
MSRKKILLIAILCAAGGALAMSSATYLLQPSVMDNGGGYASSSTYEQRGSIGGTVIGSSPSATSATYKMDVGYISTSGGAGSASWIQITQQPTPGTIGSGGTTQIKWVSSLAGTYRIELGGTGVPNSGTLLKSGSCTAGGTVTNNIAESLLTVNSVNTIYVIVTSGVQVGAKIVAVTSDRLAPTLTPTKVTVAGTCDDVTVTSVVVNGSGVPVTAGAYSALVTTGMNSISIVGTNASSKSVTRTVTVQ